MEKNTSNRQSGQVNPLLIATISIAVIALGLGGAFIWSFINYQDQKNNTDQKIEAAVSVAEDEQAAELEKKFAEQEKVPYREYVGPSDLGRVSFNYPKTWAAYLESDGTSGDYELYLHPQIVPTIDRDTPFATRIIITDDQYADVLDDYASEVEDGELASKPITVNGFEGVRLDGTFSDEIKGSASIFKVRDKTLIVASDANTFLSDYNNTVLDSLRFNP